MLTADFLGYRHVHFFLQRRADAHAHADSHAGAGGNSTASAPASTAQHYRLVAGQGRGSKCQGQRQE